MIGKGKDRENSGSESQERITLKRSTQTRDVFWR
jgi:hypothetical protein